MWISDVQCRRHTRSSPFFCTVTWQQENKFVSIPGHSKRRAWERMHSTAILVPVYMHVTHRYIGLRHPQLQSLSVQLWRLCHYLALCDLDLVNKILLCISEYLQCLGQGRRGTQQQQQQQQQRRRQNSILQPCSTMPRSCTTPARRHLYRP